MSQAMVLAFNLKDGDLMRIRALSQPLGLQVKAVPPESFATPIGAMLGLPVAPSRAPVESGGFSDPMLLMCGLDESRFNGFLRLMKGPGLPRVPLKAVLTPTNVSWSSSQLRDELVREHEAVGGR